MRRQSFFLVYFWLLLLAWTPSAVASGAAICGGEALGIVRFSRWSDPIAEFTVTVADSQEKWRQGLMQCPSLAPGTGMLFIYPDARKRIFWMKNTAIELAIVFITAEGSIAAIARGEPQSLKRIHSPDGVQMVLEINYGEHRPLSVGDRIRLLPLSD